MKNLIQCVINFLSFLFVSVIYQKIFGDEPYTNGFAVGIPRFYNEFYVGNGEKLWEISFPNFLLNIAIFVFIHWIFVRFIKPKN